MSDAAPKPALTFSALAVRRMPGFEREGFELEGFAPGVTVIIGPNASGKTTTARALGALLWPSTAPGRKVHLIARFQIGEETWEGELEAGEARYRREGRDSALPPLPPAELEDRYRLPLERLLATERDGLAAEVLRESAGGYDLSLAVQGAGFRPGATRSRKPAADLGAAEKRVRELQAHQERLVREEEALAGLDLERQRAREAARAAGRIAAALRAARARERRSRAEERLAQLPPALARLSSDADARLVELETAAREGRRRADEARAELERLGRSLAGVGLTVGAFNRARSEVRTRLEALGRAETRVEEARRRTAAARETATGAATQLGAPAGRAPGLRRPELGELDELIRVAERARAAEAVATRARFALEPPEHLEDPAPLTRAVAALRRLLATPAPPLGLFGLLVLAAAAALSAAAAFALVERGSRLGAGAAVLAAIASGGMAGLALFTWDRARRARAEVRHFVPERVPGDPAAAARLLERLDQRLETIKDGQLRARIARGLGLESGTSPERQRLEQARAEVGARLGLTELPLDLELAWAWHRAATFAEATDRARAAEAEERLAWEEEARLLGEIGTLLAPFEEGQPGDRAGAEAALERLSERARRLEADLAAKERIETQLERELEPAAMAAEARLVAFWSELGLVSGDRATLARWLEELPDWQRNRDEVRLAEREHHEAMAQLAGVEELAERDPAELEVELARLRERAEAESDLAERSGAVRREIDLARRGHDLERALAERDRAREELVRLRAEDELAVAGWLLGEVLGAELADRALPPVLAGARELFARITHERYELRVEPGDPPGFRARDRQSGEVLGLEQLSSATRVHLLVAARLAFVERQEPGPALPLFLDETLATSDERRARALIEALVAAARRGRQVFCFTAQEAEVAKWAKVLEDAQARGEGVPWTVLDLARARRGEPAQVTVAGATAGPRPVPQSAGLSHAEYGAALGVPAPDPWAADLGGVHLWYLVEDPALLERLLAAGWERWGPTEALARRGLAEAVAAGSGAALEKAAALARAGAAAREVWRVGRGRPVDRQDLAESGAVSDKYLDSLTELAREAGGDARALLERLAQKDPRAKGFRHEKLEALEGWLEERGHLDPQPPLPREEIRLAALTAAREELESGRLGLDEVDRLLARLGM
ncbi:MAG TPA: hypothetical protein VF017_06920 [Thermoanaerobaculia bacterium]|nr:hypothetical protein [Thermoanaerobaculia bacterium]